jgi:hypothetical protein
MESCCIRFVATQANTLGGNICRTSGLLCKLVDGLILDINFSIDGCR